ncbi:PucR C-terminal helix-turn-helix domain-containing protein [Amycolatopsis xylanica]|uniref:PucR C-terminal helix-turn-helix domain-containing protein n=1 Tax=Amycolatopsis xylanica TaxID=589385 RepID=A0A1H3S9A2_9PSEU|nr:helix-turn-helix domain-containing protein [Amycolatopsis xylanica]SDZ34673.1 PucR C-terminal helix-turn-helix domain-containing protein [Amycolatopsis xylanica]
MAPADAGDGAHEVPQRTDGWWRGRQSTLRGLFAVSTTMIDGRDADGIIRLAATSVSSLSRCGAKAVYLLAAGALRRRDDAEPDAELDRQIGLLGGVSGPLLLPGGGWCWGFALRGLDALLGYLVVHAAAEPPEDEFFLLEALGRQTAGALVNASQHRRERAHALELQEVNGRLSASVARLEQQTRVHEVLSDISVSSAGEPGIAHAVHQLTSLPVAIEDRFGNLRAWAGPGKPDPYPKPQAHRREELLRRAAAVPHPVREKDRVLSLVKPRHEVLAVVALVDPHDTVGGHEMFTLEYATTVLALELSHLRNLAEVELRLHRDLVDDLITGTDDESAYARADALGHDLRRAHCVIVVRWDGEQTDDTVAEAVGRAAASLQLSSMISRHSGVVVVLVSGCPEGGTLYRLLADHLGGTGAAGIGGRCDRPGDFPRSYSEALRALAIRRTSASPEGATTFDQLGLYRILDSGENRADIVAYVREWLGRLLDYDEHKSAELVQTLAQYLDRGGHYDETASALMIHRSTLRYRLGRIREITGLDLTDVDTKLNLHVAVRAWKVLGGSV